MTQFASFGSELKSLRKKAGLSQGDLASKLGYISAQFISNVERGKANLPMEQVKKTAALLKIDPNLLLAKVIAARTPLIKANGKKYLLDLSSGEILVKE